MKLCNCTKNIVKIIYKTELVSNNISGKMRIVPNKGEQGGEGIIIAYNNQILKFIYFYCDCSSSAGYKNERFELWS